MPDHVRKPDEAFGFAVRVTKVFAEKFPEQLDPQFIPLGLEVTVPFPSPLFVIESE